MLTRIQRFAVGKRLQRGRAIRSKMFSFCVGGRLTLWRCVGTSQVKTVLSSGAGAPIPRRGSNRPSEAARSQHRIIDRHLRI
jgi:hypothetical protein